MSSKGVLYPLVFSLFLFCIFISCNNAKPPETAIVSTPEELEVKASDIIRSSLAYASENDGKIDDSLRLNNIKLVQLISESNQFNTSWSNKEQWKPLADSLRNFIAESKLYGLFPEDYHFQVLDTINSRFLADTLAKTARRDAVLWSKAELLLTDAFVQIVKDIKLGRLPQDSLTQRKDSVLSDEFYMQQFQQAQQKGSLTGVFQSLEPPHMGYRALKDGIKQFLDSADYKVYTNVPSRKDTANFKEALKKRLSEGGYFANDSLSTDSIQLIQAVKAFQQSKGITVDGKAGEGTIRMLNFSDREKFVRIAISLDRYKMLPDTLPSRYIWVNLPAFYMQLIQDDSVLITSKIVCGKSLTRTPLLTSAISNLVTYPQWTIPESIITKEVLPGIKRDSNYLLKKGYSLIDSKGDEVNPNTVDWSKYKKGIPYKVVQGSGDENALGILKFNFPNKYAVYLHDTNQRYLFERDMRSLSHGCVRVQQWEKLAYNIVRYDNEEKYSDGPSPVEDSLTTWLQRKEKHTIPVRKKLPLFIRYFTCEGKNGKLLFYDDIYGEDKYLHEKYFTGK
ncbi:MAG: L,D-transpeptidase family protein [Chitinophagaceae bacterium]